MNKEEIESRILICEIKEREYREVGNTKSANRYSNEIKKWEKLLEQLDSNNYDELLTYKKGYNNLKQALNEIRECCENNAIEVNTREYGNLIVTNTDDILQIIDKVLGDGK